MKELLRRYMMRTGNQYIFPTQMGGYLLGLIFLMFLLSIGYSNNLLLIFTLFLFGYNLIWVIQTHFQLRSSQITLALNDGHALSEINYHYQGPEAKLTLIRGHDKVTLQDGVFKLPGRGVWKWDYLLVSSTKPFGLYRTWRFVKFNHSSFAYPGLIREFTPPLLENLNKEGELSSQKFGSGDFHGLVTYSGQDIKRISWKHYARSGELLIKQGEDQRSFVAVFDATIKLDEQSLSVMATQLVQCHRQGVEFELKLKDKPPVSDFKDALRELAQC